MVKFAESFEKFKKIIAGEKKDLAPVFMGKKIAEGDLAKVYEARKPVRSVEGEGWEAGPDDEHIIKRLTLLDMKMYQDAHLPKSSHERFKYTFGEFHHEYQKSLELLKKHFAKYLPDMQLVFGEPEQPTTQDKKQKKGTGYLVSEKIYSQDIDKQDIKSREKYLASKDELLASLARYFFDSENEGSGSVTIPDFEGKNDIVYGYAKKRETPQMYLWDGYPLFKRVQRAEFLKKLHKVMAREKGFDFPMTNAMLKIKQEESPEEPVARWL